MLSILLKVDNNIFVTHISQNYLQKVLLIHLTRVLDQPAGGIFCKFFVVAKLLFVPETVRSVRKTSSLDNFYGLQNTKLRLKLKIKQ